MKTIAVIDDEPFIGDMLEKALRENLLMSGAADYVTKPFEIKELLARIAIRLRGSGASGDGEVLSCEEIELRPASRSVTVHGQEARLTRTEYAILRLLMQNAGQVLTRSTLLDRISIDTPDCTESSLKIHVSNLRGSCRYQAGDRELKNAVTNIAHDLRTPLTAISGYLEMLSDEDLPSNVRGDLDIIANRVEALKTLTEEMLHYSVANADHAYEGREEVELRGEIETCVAGFYGALTERGISPEIQLPAYPVTRILNRIALGRILGNIMTNALRQSDGDLRITLTDDGEIVFANRARNLDDVTVGRLFDRFYTVEKAREGTGLGLSIAKALTQKMHGSIEAAKNGEDFIVRVFSFASPNTRAEATQW